MANPAAFIVPLRYTCSAFHFLPRGQSWGSHAFSPVQKCQFLLQQKLFIVNTGCWHIQDQPNTTTKRQYLQKKHICKKPIIMASTVNQESGGHSGWALQQYIKHSPFLRSNILQLLHYQRRNWYPQYNTTTKTLNLARERLKNDSAVKKVRPSLSSGVATAVVISLLLQILHHSSLLCSLHAGPQFHYAIC
jgi:hypothetical protein